MSQTIFGMIINKEIPSWVIWEDDSFLAFLTPFPNTPGASVVIPKKQQGDYLFDLDDQQMTDLTKAAKKVAKLLEKAFNVKRVAMVVEGTGVAWVHVKLYPLHGALGAATDVFSKHQEFYPEYAGYLTTVEGPRMADEELTKLQEKIRGAKS